MIMMGFYDRQLGFSQQKLGLATLPESLDKHILGQILTNGNELVVVSRGPISRLGFGTVYATSSLGLARQLWRGPTSLDLPALLMVLSHWLFAER